MKNFKIADIKTESRYTVTTTDRENGTTATEEMTGAELVALAQGAAHLYALFKYCLLLRA